MTLSRRDLLKGAAGGGLLWAAGVGSAAAATRAPLPPEAVGILYDATLCIGCKSCMVNCKRVNSQEPGGALYEAGKAPPYEFNTPERIYDAPLDLSDQTLCMIRAFRHGSGLAKDRAENGYSFVKSHCLHCLDPACAAVCPVAAFSKDPRTGVVSYRPERCIGCRYCQMACPFGIPRFQWGSAKPKLVKCQLCHHRYGTGGYAACCEFCPTGASIFGRVADLRAEVQRRLAASPGADFDFPVQTVGSSFRLRRPLASYVNRAYGMSEAGGTQYLLLAGVPFDLLGFNPRITDERYPDSTWAYVEKVPVLIATLLVAGTALRFFATSRDDKSQQTTSNT
ncbi:MAG: hydrogenase 2 operon protein HybA [Thermodesulfobacteriota bacterium]